MLETIRTIVHNFEASDTVQISPKPTVVTVISVIYSALSQQRSEMSLKPKLPTNTSSIKCSRANNN